LKSLLTIQTKQLSSGSLKIENLFSTIMVSKIKNNFIVLGEKNAQLQDHANIE